MKPTLQIIQNRNHRDASTHTAFNRGLLKIDQNLRPNRHADFAGRCHGSPAPSFRRISDDYFANEAPGHFISEAAVFGLMVVTAAVPVLQGAFGAVHFLRVVGLL